MSYRELTAEQLKFHCPLDRLTEDLPRDQLDGALGQPRAVKALNFGLNMKSAGYNIYISGHSGTGRITYTRKVVKEMAARETAPADICIVNNFKNPAQPVALIFCCGQGIEFKSDIDRFVEELRNTVAKTFSGEDYELAKSQIVKKMQEQRSVILEDFNEMAEKMGILPQWSSTGFVGMPIVNGEPLTSEEFQKLDREQREQLEKKMLTVHDEAVNVVKKIQRLERSMREDLRELDAKIAMFSISHLIDEIEHKYTTDDDTLHQWLEDLKQDIIKNINELKPGHSEEESPMAQLFSRRSGDIRDRYRVNLLVDNSQTQGAPVVFEQNPTYYNLVGRVEYETRMSVVSTDYTMIKPGALLRANGGYLIVQARDLLVNVGAWEALKRCLKTQTLQLENLGDHYGLLAMSTLKPKPIPVRVKVIIVGSPLLYHLLYNYDDDFRKLFRVFADFDTEMDNDQQNVRKYAALIESTIQSKQLRPFDLAAVATVVEYASRLAGSQKKLTTKFSEIIELLCEADACAAAAGDQQITLAHVRQAIQERRYRYNRYEEKLQEYFNDGKILIDTDGRKVGQINGLAVLSVGKYAFGKPSRITANTYLGRSGIINIEKETRMSGTTHTKGVLTLSGYLGERYAQKFPLSLSCSLTFEQLYQGIDGDSASAAELFAILSSLSGQPIKQNIAVTGSVNQKGEIQPIGGVTEKIEGFFSVCRQKGLTGSQGVIIPEQNISDLALGEEVIEAVAGGTFHIYPIRTIDEGIEILTDVPAGVMDENGEYPASTIHGMVMAKLRRNHELLAGNDRRQRSGRPGSARRRRIWPDRSYTR
ncbi:MAG: AAA family ATPase [Negativicutes bacterium]|nr:AAA family ATPase [Negativicutes bacterium]